MKRFWLQINKSTAWAGWELVAKRKKHEKHEPPTSASDSFWWQENHTLKQTLTTPGHFPSSRNPSSTGVFEHLPLQQRIENWYLQWFQPHPPEPHSRRRTACWHLKGSVPLVGSCQKTKASANLHQVFCSKKKGTKVQSIPSFHARNRPDLSCFRIPHFPNVRTGSFVHLSFRPRTSIGIFVFLACTCHSKVSNLGNLA